MSNALRGSSGARRPLRIAAELEREMPDLIRDIAELPRGTFLTVTSVEVTSDLLQARVYFSLIGAQENNGAEIERRLNERRGEFRKAISQRLIMRQHPEIRFCYDETPRNAARIEELLKQVRPEDDSQ
ncbi:30S ribosome-binding factor RbfA [bacterium]|jgi:ribosome-binding factor A|nr:30S ribosome-binding factor RbfA [bacterium]